MSFFLKQLDRNPDVDFESLMNKPVESNKKIYTHYSSAIMYYKVRVLDVERMVWALGVH